MLTEQPWNESARPVNTRRMNHDPGSRFPVDLDPVAVRVHALERHPVRVVVVLDENPPAEQADNARKAEAGCPALAIHLEE